MNRRAFLGMSVAAAAGGITGVSAAPAREALAGSQLYGWGQYYDRDHKSLGDHLDEVFAALKDSGYDYAEGNLDTGAPDNNQAFAEALRKRGLRPVSLYTGGALHTEAVARATVERISKGAAGAAKAGFSIINYNVDPIGRPKTDAELAVQAKAMAELGGNLRRLGMRLGIHHHTPEFADSAREYHSNFRACPPELAGYCYDVHWAYRGGVEPAEALAKYGDRVVSWHLRQSRDKIWWEDLDGGDVDYPWIAKFAAEHALPALYTVELALEGGAKVTRGAVANHARSRAYLKRVFGV